MLPMVLEPADADTGVYADGVPVIGTVGTDQKYRVAMLPDYPTGRREGRHGRRGHEFLRDWDKYRTRSEMVLIRGGVSLPLRPIPHFFDAQDPFTAYTRDAHPESEPLSEGQIVFLEWPAHGAWKVCASVRRARARTAHKSVHVHCVGCTQAGHYKGFIRRAVSEGEPHPSLLPSHLRPTRAGKRRAKQMANHNRKSLARKRKRKEQKAQGRGPAE